MKLSKFRNDGIELLLHRATVRLSTTGPPRPITFTQYSITDSIHSSRQGSLRLITPVPAFTLHLTHPFEEFLF